MTRPYRVSTIVVFLAFLIAFPLRSAQASDEARPTPRRILSEALSRWADLVEPPDDAKPQTFVAQLKLTRAEGLPREADGLMLDLSLQAPDCLRITGIANGVTFMAARDGQELWAYEPQKKFGVIGKPSVVLFKAEPNRLDDTHLPPFSLPISRLKLSMVPLMLDVQLDAGEQLQGESCDVLKIGLRPEAAELFGVSIGQAKLWLRQTDRFPLRISYADGKGVDVQLDVIDPKLVQPWSAQQWRLEAAPGDDIQTVAVSHLVKFLHVAPKIAMDKVPALGPPTGERRLAATEGKGRLEEIDGTHVLFLKGSPREMGKQEGKLLKKECRQIAQHILYGIGVGSSFDTGKWFFGEVEGAESRLEPFMDKRYLTEIDAMADAAGIDRQEARLANFFPELFHCTGFSLFGKATRDGHMYHGRVLDYLKGVGLEQNAIVIVYQPDYGNAWVNLGYAGFIGSVTAMNEKGISIGEMGGKGYGNWDGKPMAQLVREVMEKADTLDDAVRIMRDSPRTCEYYYVISDGKSKQAVGIAATPDKFVVSHPGESFPQLPHSLADSVLMSAGERYETLCQRVKEGYGTFDADSARDLMTRPVCMTSNIQSVLFEPDTLDFWVANADSNHVASATRYTHYNLRELLRSEPPKGAFEF